MPHGEHTTRLSSGHLPSALPSLSRCSAVSSAGEHAQHVAYFTSDISSALYLPMEGGAEQQEKARSRRIPNWLLVFCVVASLSVVVAAVSFHGPSEPVYAGARLSHWLGGTVSSGPGSSGVLASLAEVGSALGSVGPEALPWLLSALPGLEFKQRFDAWCLRTGNRSGSALVNRLLLKLTDPHRATAYANACSLLARFAPGSAFETKALRAFVPRRPEDAELIKIRIRALGRCTNSPAQAIPILISELTNSPTADVAIESLGNFGPAATPRLYPVALREAGMIRPAEVALERADPLAYKRLREEKEKRNL